MRITKNLPSFIRLFFTQSTAYWCLFLVQFVISFSAQAQEMGKYIVYFKDKPTNIDVTKLFNEKALQYRKQFNIPFDERDIPVHTNYIEQLKNNKATIINSSGWLNAALISVDEQKINNIEQLPFVISITKIKKSNKGGIAAIEETNGCEETNATQTFEDNYGSSFPQGHLLNGEYLHQQGFNGENMIIAVCDNGFPNANTNPAFTHVFNENRLLGTYDYVHNDSLVYDNDGGHGLNCFSFIAGLKANQYIGTATKASFYLFHTENNSGERLQEEFNLATALERCNQLGVNVVSISLGYMYFDDASENHDTTDIKLGSTPAARAANIAVSKGIIVCSAGGNNDSNGKYIVAPACADSVLAIAGVDLNGSPLNFSVGVPGDPRIKPNVAALGINPWYFSLTGQLINANGGTSYATPQIAGWAACLWQAFPSKSNWEIKTAIEQSASQYLTPDKHVGYGIPDFQKAYNLLATATFVSNKSLENELTIYPNPFQSAIYLENKGNSKIQAVNVLNNVGQSVLTINAPTENAITLADLPKGMYLLQIATDKGMFIKKLIKD